MLVYLSCLMMREKQRACVFVKADDMLRQFDDVRRLGDESIASVKRFYTTPYLLCIDELDKRVESWSEDREICQLTDDRYAEGMPTIFAGNYKPDNFQAIINKSILARIEERGEIIVTDGWRNFRRRKTHDKAGATNQ